MDTVTAVPTSTRRRVSGSWSWWLVIGGVGILIVAGIMVAILTAQQKPTTYPANSPEGTLQRYVRLLQDGQVDRAYGMTDLVATEQEFHDRFDNWSQTSHRVTIVRTHRQGTEATITVDISTFSDGPTGPSDSTQRTTFTLQRLAGTWRITGPEYLPY